MGLLKEVLVKKTDYSEITDALELKQYGLNCVSTGSASALFTNPAITTAFYLTMTNAANAIQTAINVWILAPTDGNKSAIKDAMDALVVILDAYANQVEIIANLTANAPTREAAATNIRNSYLTPQKLESNSKGTPPTAIFTASIENGGIIALDITNTDFDVAVVVIVAVAVPPVTTPATPLPTVTLSGGQVVVNSKVSVPVITKTYTGKAKTAKLTGMDSNPSWLIFIYSMNGNKLISAISAGVVVNLVTPPTVPPPTE